MSKVWNPKAWYLIGIGAVALVADGARRLIKKRREEAESAPAVYEPADEHIPFIKPERAAEPQAETRSAAKPEVKAPAPTPESKAKLAAKPAKAKKDDLTEIKGIGPTYAKRLTAAGITTFAQLAAASPDHLREVTKATAMTNPEEWIAQAAGK